MEKNRATNRQQRRLARKRRREIKGFTEPMQFSKAYDRLKRAILEKLRTEAWTLAHSD